MIPFGQIFSRSFMSINISNKLQDLPQKIQNNNYKLLRYLNALTESPITLPILI